jgi:hypothetical protein
MRIASAKIINYIHSSVDQRSAGLLEKVVSLNSFVIRHKPLGLDCKTDEKIGVTIC